MAHDCDYGYAEKWNVGDLVVNNNNNNNNNSNCRLRVNSKNADSLVDYVKLRYFSGRIYTEANSRTLVMVNNGPESDRIHADDFRQFYRRQKRYGSMASHLYRQCWWCYKATFEQGRDHCIAFMGEMGSGKTRTFDRALHFITICFAGQSSFPAQQLLNAQTVLKSFGGVRLKDGEESCRFAQLLEIEVDFNGVPRGARISVLPLDRTDVMERMSQYGGFNIFYAILLGADLHLLKILKLQRNPNFYAYLKHESTSGHSGIPGSSADCWRKHFNAVKAALVALKFTPSEMEELFKLLAVLLKLGNVAFRAYVNVDGSVGCCLDNETEIVEAAELLGCENKDELLIALTKREDINEFAQSTPNPDVDESEARARRNSICEAVWCRLFYWITGKLNAALRELRDQQTSKASTMRLRRICLLDNVGFEPVTQPKHHKDRHLDRLLRNYAAERLFCQFATAEFRRQQQLYVTEGLQWTPTLETTDFDPATAVIEMAMDCKGAVQTTPCTNGPTSMKQSFSSPTSVYGSGELLVTHFFGEVAYDFTNFDKDNALMVPGNFAKAFWRSSNQLAKLLFPEGADCVANAKACTRKPLSISTQFRASLSSMLKTLEEAQCSYVVCVKPNDRQNPGIFDKDCVERQLKAFRISSLVRVGAAGFAYNFTYDEFLERFKMLSPLTWPKWSGPNARGGVTTIVRHQQISPSYYALGRERVFVKNTEILSVLEERRNRCLNYLASTIQRTFRRWVSRFDRRNMFDRSQTVIASSYRAYRTRIDFLKQRQASVVIQAHYRGWTTRKEYANVRRRHSARILCEWLKNIVANRYLLKLAKNLPSQSPLATDWPDIAPSFCRLADDQLRQFYHKWRCRKYRLSVDQQSYFRMREKLASSLVFKDKKASYPLTVGHPFRGDYVRIRQNSKWRRMASETGDEYVVFADLVSKLHRSSGKISPELLVVSTNGIIIMDHRTLTMKYRAMVCDLVKISVSPFADSVAVLHFRNNSLTRKSGDFVFECRHLIEVVAKMYLVVHNATGKPPFVNISSTIFIDTGTETTELLFHDRESEKDERDDWTGCFVSTPVLPLKFSKSNATMRHLSDDTSCSSTSESSACALASTAKLKLVKRGNRIDFYV